MNKPGKKIGVSYMPTWSSKSAALPRWTRAQCRAASLSLSSLLFHMKRIKESSFIFTVNSLPEQQSKSVNLQIDWIEVSCSNSMLASSPEEKSFKGRLHDPQQQTLSQILIYLLSLHALSSPSMLQLIGSPSLLFRNAKQSSSLTKRRGKWSTPG